MVNKNDSIDWAEEYFIATSILGWSDEDFWKSTPRKLLACLAKYGERNKPRKPKPVSGKDALKELQALGGML